jgi:hypothetical protein
MKYFSSAQPNDRASRAAIPQLGGSKKAMKAPLSPRCPAAIEMRDQFALRIDAEMLVDRLDMVRDGVGRDSQLVGNPLSRHRWRSVRDGVVFAISILISARWSQSISPITRWVSAFSRGPNGGLPMRRWKKIELRM